MTHLRVTAMAIPSARRSPLWHVLRLIGARAGSSRRNRYARGIRGTVVAATLLVVEACPCQPSATLPSLKLEWPQVQGCPTGDEVRRAVAQHLGESSGYTNEVDAIAVIEHRTSYHLVLSMLGSAGQDTRELNGDTCQSVVDAAVVILAITLGAEPGELARKDEVTSTVVPQSNWSALPPTTGQRLSSNVKLMRRRFELPPTEMPNSLSLGIGLGLYVPFHISRSALLGVIASGHVERSGWRLQSEVGWVPERKLGLAGDSSRGAWVTLGLIVISAGPVIQRGALEWIPRIGFSEQVLHGRGFGADATASRWVYFPSARVGSVLQLRALSPLYVSAMFDLTVPLRRPALLIVPGGEVLRPAYLGIDTALCVGLRF
ncbi:MAG TPA: hypothetical protein VKP30_30695 [Polyangiaceae bacterium]|nr:hypothetical protein [Polyangiaceae bacterium]